MHILCRDRAFGGIQAVIFDKDGTLSASEDFLWQLGDWRSRLLAQREPAIGALLRQVFGLDALGVRPDGLMAIGSRHDNLVAAATCLASRGMGWPKAIALAEQAFQEADQQMHGLAAKRSLIPGVLALLQQLHQVGLKLAILSSDSLGHVEEFIQTWQLEGYFGVVIGAMPHLRKPDPQLFHHTCEQLGVTAIETLMVGDSDLDLQMARRANAAGAIGVTWGWRQPPQALQAADVMVDRVNQIQLLYSPPLSPLVGEEFPEIGGKRCG